MIKLITLILPLIFVLFLSPTITFAAPTCTEANVKIEYTPSFIPESALEARFTFSNLPNDVYFMNIKSQSAILQGGYFSSEINTTGGSVSFLIKADPRQNPPFPYSGVYSGILRKNTSPSGTLEEMRTFTDFCTFTFNVGTSYTMNDCIAEAPITVQTGQDIIITLSRAPRAPSSFLDPNVAIIKQFGTWKWPVAFNGKYIGQTEIDSSGNGTFIIPNNPHTALPKASAEFFLVAPSEKEKLINWIPIVNSFFGDASGKAFCKASFSIVSSSSTITPQCRLNPTSPTINTPDVSIIAANLPKKKLFRPVITHNDKSIHNDDGRTSGDNGYAQIPLVPNKGGKLAEGSYNVKIVDETDKAVCEQSFSIGAPNSNPCSGKGCIKGGSKACKDTSKGPGIETAIGCIHTDPKVFVSDFMKFALGISGGFAFLLMLLGAFQMITSNGNPDALQNGRSRLTSAIIGLLFVIFATLLMQIIGVDILFKGFEGFGK